MLRRPVFHLLQGGKMLEVDREVVALHQRKCPGQPVGRLGHTNVLQLHARSSQDAIPIISVGKEHVHVPRG